MNENLPSDLFYFVYAFNPYNSNTFILTQKLRKDEEKQMND